MKILAIIPARSGSKGLKDKNIKKINKKPMIVYTISSALESKIFEDIVVSTDSAEYAEISKKNGATVPFLRPNKLSDDKSTSCDVILHTLEEMEKLGKYYDYFMLLQPTSPLRTSSDVVNAYRLLKKKNANSVISVTEADHSPLWMNTIDDNLNIDDFLDKQNNKRRQELKKYYRLNGAIYLVKVDFFKKYKNYYKKNSFAYIMPKERSIDVDDEFDFKLAELLLREREENAKTID